MFKYLRGRWPVGPWRHRHSLSGTQSLAQTAREQLPLLVITATRSPLAFNAPVAPSVSLKATRLHPGALGEPAGCVAAGARSSTLPKTAARAA